MSNRSSNSPQRQPSQQVVQHASFYSGIIPKAEELERYEQISPGFANRIISMTEQEGHHRRSLEKKVIWMGFFNSMTGLLFAFLSVVGISYLCYQFMLNNFATQAAWIAVSVLVSIAAVFRFQRRKPNH